MARIHGMIVLRSFQLVKASELRIQMNDAGRDRRFRANDGDYLGEALQAIDDGDQDVADAAGLQLVHHLQPELRSFALLDPQPEHVFLAVDIERQRDVHRFVANQAVVADFDPERVEEDHGINRIERPVLPLPNLLENGIGDPADQIGRDLDAIKLLQVALNLAHRHAAGVETDDPAVETVEAGLALRHQLRLEAPLAVPWNLDLQVAVVRLRRLPGVAVANVPRSAAGRITLLVSQLHISSARKARALLPQQAGASSISAFSAASKALRGPVG